MRNEQAVDAEHRSGVAGMVHQFVHTFKKATFSQLWRVSFTSMRAGPWGGLTIQTLLPHVMSDYVEGILER